MHRPHCLATFVLGTLVFATLYSTARSANVLDNVPHDALGFVVVKNLGATDTKVARLLQTLNAQYPAPLVFLEAVTGIREGLDPKGDFLLATLPSNDSPDAAPQYCVWLPVADYDRLLNLLEATPGDAISAVRLADEDLLIAKQGDWAVLVDPNQRPRLEQMLRAGSNPPAAAVAWKVWINNNDATAVLLRPGIQQVLAWSAKPPRSSEPDDNEPEDDLFGVVDEPAENDPFAGVEGEPTPNPLYPAIHREVHKWVIRSPKVRELTEQADAIGGGIRLDDSGNAFTSLRLKSSSDRTWGDAPNVPLPSALFEKGDFIVSGAGHFPPALMAVVASAQVWKTLDDFKTSDRLVFDEDLATKFHDSFVTAATDVTSWSIVHQPSDEKSGVYNNNFFVVRVPSAQTFIGHAADVMDHWNNMHRETESETHYVFDIEESKVGASQATQYSLDVAAMDDMQAIPEMRKIMETFFGPGGKLRIWVIPIDEQTVLLANATPEQVTGALQSLDRREPIDWNKPEFEATNKLLADKLDWRVFFSPRGHYAWKRRQTDAMNNGVPVIGGKRARDFPASPPVAFYGNIENIELEVNAAVPGETIKSAGKYFQK